jgi:hypothetical protein
MKAIMKITKIHTTSTCQPVGHVFDVFGFRRGRLAGLWDDSLDGMLPPVVPRYPYSAETP